VAVCAVVVIGVGAAYAGADHYRNRVSIAGRGDAPTTTTTTESSTTTSTSPPTTTSPTSLPAVVTPTIAGSARPPQPATADDFTGILQSYRDTCNPCPTSFFEKGIVFVIRNNTDHPIDLSTAAPVRVALVCATNMTSDGQLTAPLPVFPEDTLFADIPVDANGQSHYVPEYDKPGTSLAPGAQVTTSDSYSFASGEPDPIVPGPATCEGAIVSTSDGTWKPETLSVVAPLANVPTYKFDVYDDTTTTSTTAPAVPDTTTTTAP
jgi:hypothetical protein